MIDFATLILIAGSIAIVVLPAIVLTHWLAGGEGASLADILAIPVDPPWPRGIQEEEPVRWHTERLRQTRGRAPAPAGGDRKPARAGAGLATEPGDC